MADLLASVASTIAAGHLAITGRNVELSIQNKAGGVVTEVSSLKKGLPTLGEDVYQLVKAEVSQNQGKLTTPPTTLPTIPSQGYGLYGGGFISKTSPKADSRIALNTASTGFPSAPTAGYN